MKVKYYLLFAVLLFTNQLFAQTKCSCEEALQNIIKKIEVEYPGFEEKTRDKELYNNLKKQILSESKSASDSTCISILERYTGIFKDHHIWILPKDTIQILKNKNEAIRNPIFDINIKKFMGNASKFKEGIEGVWKSESYEIGLKKLANDDYVGFIIKADPKYWKQNEVKFRLFKNGKFEYYSQDHSVQRGSYKIIDNSLLYFSDLRLAFIRELPASTLNKEQIDEQINEMNGFYFKRLTAKTSILKLQNFSSVFVETIEKLIEKNEDLLENSENLIIDLRDNGGGTDNAYQKLLPYILTNPSRRMIGVEHLSTQTTITAYEQWLQTLKTDSIKNKDDIEKAQRYVAKLKSNFGKFVNLAGDSVIVDTIKLAPKSPRQIAILTNGNVGSAAEDLTLSAKQSKKVKILGTPTAGGLDYADARFFEFGCSNYQLLLPTYRSLRLPDFPIDNIGIQPDIYIDRSVKDWVKFTLDYLEQ